MTENRIKPIVLVDLDDTLLDFKKAEAIAISKIFVHFGIEPTEELIAHYSRINQQHWEMLEEGLVSREQVLRGRFEQFFGELGVEASATKAQQLYESNLAIGHYFKPGAPEMLESLRGGYRLFICSNGTSAVQAGRIGSAGIGDRFERIFISEELGANKPDAEYFERCFAQIPQFHRERTIIVGDSLTSDIRGGINAGIKTCWYNPGHRQPSESIRADYETDDLRCVKKILESAFGV